MKIKNKGESGRNGIRTTCKPEMRRNRFSGSILFIITRGECTWSTGCAPLGATPTPWTGSSRRGSTLPTSRGPYWWTGGTRWGEWEWTGRDRWGGGSSWMRRRFLDESESFIWICQIVYDLWAVSAWYGLENESTRTRFNKCKSISLYCSEKINTPTSWKLKKTPNKNLKILQIKI